MVVRSLHTCDPLRDSPSLRALDLDSPGPLLSRSMGLSLSDHYWIRPSDTSVSWNEVNFFDNGFSDDLGDLLFGKDVWVGEWTSGPLTAPPTDC